MARLSELSVVMTGTESGVLFWGGQSVSAGEEVTDGGGKSATLGAHEPGRGDNRESSLPDLLLRTGVPSVRGKEPDGDKRRTVREIRQGSKSSN